MPVSAIGLCSAKWWQRKSLREGESMQRTTQTSPASWWRALVRDPHWWVPVGALLAGLVVLQWIQS